MQVGIQKKQGGKIGLNFHTGIGKDNQTRFNILILINGSFLWFTRQSPDNGKMAFLTGLKLNNEKISF